MEKGPAPRKPEAKATTVPQAPSMLSAERTLCYNQQVAAARKARMSAAERKKLVGTWQLRGSWQLQGGPAAIPSSDSWTLLP